MRTKLFIETEEMNMARILGRIPVSLRFAEKKMKRKKNRFNECKKKKDYSFSETSTRYPDTKDLFTINMKNKIRKSKDPITERGCVFMSLQPKLNT